MERMNGSFQKRADEEELFYSYTYADWGSSVIRMIFSLFTTTPTSLIARAVCRSGGEFCSLNHSRAHHHHQKKDRAKLRVQHSWKVI